MTEFTLEDIETAMHAVISAHLSETLRDDSVVPSILPPTMRALKASSPEVMIRLTRELVGGFKAMSVVAPNAASGVLAFWLMGVDTGLHLAAAKELEESVA